MDATPLTPQPVHGQSVVARLVLYFSHCLDVRSLHVITLPAFSFPTRG
jgi:hypothetical protein